MHSHGKCNGRASGEHNSTTAYSTHDALSSPRAQQLALAGSKGSRWWFACWVTILLGYQPVAPCSRPRAHAAGVRTNGTNGGGVLGGEYWGESPHARECPSDGLDTPGEFCKDTSWHHACVSETCCHALDGGAARKVLEKREGHGDDTDHALIRPAPPPPGAASHRGWITSKPSPHRAQAHKCVRARAGCRFMWRSRALL